MTSQNIWEYLLCALADNLVIWTTDKYHILSRTKLYRALLNISVFCKLWKLQVNAQKTLYTIFSDSQGSSENLKIDLEKEQSPVYHGVTLDRQMNITDYIDNIKERAAAETAAWKQIQHFLSSMYSQYLDS